MNEDEKKEFYKQFETPYGEEPQPLTAVFPKTPSEAVDNAFGTAASKLLRKPVTKKAVESTTAHVRARVRDELTPEQQKKIIKLYEQGHSGSSIAKKLGVELDRKAFGSVLRKEGYVNVSL